MNISSEAFAMHSCSTGASCGFTVRSSPVRSVRCVETKCSMPYLWRTKCTLTQYGRLPHFHDTSSLRIGECSARRMRRFHAGVGSFVPAPMRIVVRAASATSRHVPITFRNLRTVCAMASPYLAVSSNTAES